MVFTGLRLAEAIGLTWNCVDFEKRRLTINKQLQERPLAGGGFTFTPLKTDKTRAIAPAPFVLELLKRWWKVQVEERLKAGRECQGWKSEKERQTAFGFTTPFGTHLHPQTVYIRFKKFAAEIGAPNAPGTRSASYVRYYFCAELANGCRIFTSL